MDVKSNIPGLPAGSRAALIVDSNVKVPGGFLNLLGRPPRESACECERSSGMQLGPVLNMINGPVIADAINTPGNRIDQIVAKEKNDAKVVEQLFLAILNRPPTANEIKIGVKAIQDGLEDHKQMLAKANKLKADLEAHLKVLDGEQTVWEAEMKKSVKWEVVEPEEIKAAKGTTLKKLDDHSILANGKNPTPETYTITWKTEITGITGVRLEVLTDTSLPKKGPGRAPNGNFVLTDFRLAVAPAKGDAKPKPMKFKRAIADFSQGAFDVKRAIDNNKNTGWAISPQLSRDHTAVFETAKEVGFKDGTKLIINMEHNFNGKQHNIGRFRLAFTTAPTPLKIKLLPDNIVKILHTPEEKRNDAQKNALTNYFRAQDDQLRQLQDAVSSYRVPADPRAVGAQDLSWALINSPAFLFNH